MTVTLFFLYYSGKIRCGTWTTDGNKLVLCVGAVLLVRWFYYWVWGNGFCTKSHFKEYQVKIKAIINVILLAGINKPAFLKL